MSSLTSLVTKVRNNPLIRHSIYSLIARFTGVALNFAVILIITNELSKSAAGDILLLMTFITGVALISRLGTDQLLMKEIASASEDNHIFKNQFLTLNYKAVYFLSLIFMALWVIASGFMQNSFFNNGNYATVNREELVIASIGILFFNFVILNSTYLKAIKKTVHGVLGQNALTAVSFLVVILLFWPYFKNNQYIVYLYTVSLVIAGIFATIYTYRFIDNSEKTSGLSENKFNVKKVIIQALPLAPISIISYLMIFTDTIMVGWFLPNDQVAEYSVASRVSYIILFFLQAMEATIYPRLLHMFRHSRALITTFFWQSTILVISVILVVTLIMYSLSDWILIAFGSEYIAAKKALGILLIAQLFRAATITFSFMFIIREKVRYLNIILVIAFIVNIMCNLLFIKSYGIEGAAIATLFANASLLLLVLILFYFHKLLSVTVLADEQQ